MRTTALSVLLFAALLGCADQTPHDKGEASGKLAEGACIMVGNTESRHYCATTYIQLLANPEQYEGRLVRVQGWAVSDGRGAVLFPSLDSLEGVETNASIVLQSGPALERVIEELAVFGPGAKPVRISVDGRFKLNRKAANGPMTLGGHSVGRFGALVEIDGMSH